MKTVSACGRTGMKTVLTCAKTVCFGSWIEHDTRGSSSHNRTASDKAREVVINCGLVAELSQSAVEMGQTRASVGHGIELMGRRSHHEMVGHPCRRAVCRPQK